MMPGIFPGMEKEENMGITKELFGRGPKLFSCSEIDAFIARLRDDYGYVCANTDQGVLTSGNWVCLPPDGNHYGFVIREVALNCWSSAQKVKRFRRLPKKYAYEAEAAWAEEAE